MKPGQRISITKHEYAIKLKVKDDKGAYSAEVTTTVSITDGEGQGGESGEPSNGEFGQVSNLTM